MDIEKINMEGGKPIIRLINQLKINDLKDNYGDINELSKIIAEVHKRIVLFEPFFRMEFLLDDTMKFNIGFSNSFSLIDDKQRPVSEIKNDIINILSKVYKDPMEKDLDKMASSILELDNKLYGSYNESNEFNEIIDDNNTNDNDIDDNETFGDILFQPIMKSINSNISNSKWRSHFKVKFLNNINEGDINEMNESQRNIPFEPFTVKTLNEKYSNINWKIYLEGKYEAIDKTELITDDTKIYLSDEAYIENLNRVLGETDGESLSYYFEW